MHYKVCIIYKFSSVNKGHVVRTDAKLVWYVNLVWQVRLKNMVSVSFDTSDENRLFKVISNLLQDFKLISNQPRLISKTKKMPNRSLSSNNCNKFSNRT